MATTPAIPNKNVQLRKYPLKTSQTTVEGDMVYLDTNGDVLTVGADPATVLGFQMHDYNGALEVDIYDDEVIVACAYPGSTFWLEGTSDPTQAAEGQQYGAVVTSDAIQVDLTDTDNIVFQVERVDLVRLLLEVSVIPSVAQLQGG